MDIQELLATAKEQTFERFERKLNELIRLNSRFSNLGPANRQALLGIIKKHLPNIHNGYGISGHTIQREMYHLYQNRLKLNLTEEDLRDIKEILFIFKK
jgi:hypothetical protein